MSQGRRAFAGIPHYPRGYAAQEVELTKEAAPAEAATRELLVELLNEFWRRGWVSGTGGGICGPADGGGLLLAPTGVHKERVRTDEFFTVDPSDGRVVRSPDRDDLRPSECNSIFCLTHRARGAWSVVHSHALSAVLTGDIAATSGRASATPSSA